MAGQQNCYSCGKEIHFDSNFKSNSGKYIPLSGKTGTSKHRCPAKPFNKETRRQWWWDQEQQQKQRQEEQIQQQHRIQRYKRIGKYLDVLHLSPFCSSIDEIKKTYRALALFYHPDRSNDPSTTDKFIEIQEAYEKCLEELK